HEALLSGGIDVYVEYTGTSLTAIFKEPPANDSDQVFNRVRDRYAALGLTLLPKLGFNNTFAILVRGDAAGREHLARTSDLGRVAPGWTAGFGYEFLERPDGFPGLSAAYGLRFSGPPRVMDLNLIYRAVAAGDIDVTAGDATSGLIEALKLVALEDDKHYFPVYDAAPVARATLLLERPEVAAALRALEGHLSAAQMRRMNYAVDGEKQDPAAVVRAFLDMIGGI
ncbi:MAG: glycine betaine ABC transporter substrate-binding protein, partial [Vicinamibacterales bacterium]